MENETAIPALRNIQPDMPPFVGKYWSGRSVYWGEGGVTPQAQKGSPRFLRGRFNARAGIMSNLNMKGWGRGFALLNGFNLGRFWGIGPQETLYIPGGLLRDRENELVIFELYSHARRPVDFVAGAVRGGEHREAVI